MHAKLRSGVMFRARSPCQSSGCGDDDDNDDSKKSNSMSTKIEKSLQDWKLPPCSASDISKRSSLFNFCCSPNPTVKTMEKEIPLSDGYSSFSLFTENLQRVYPSQMCVLNVGKIQVALKPTKLGSNISAVICLRDKRHQRFHESLLGMVESSLCDGPIYFSFSPTYCVSLYQPRSSIDAFSIDVKIQGSSSSTSVPAGDRNVILMYRFHYNVRRSNVLRSRSRAVVGEKETTLFVTNVARGNRVVSRKVYWDQVSVPERWLGENKPPSSSSAGKQGEVARIDLKVAAEAYVLRVEVPGFKKEEVKVEVEAGRSLVISGERSNEEEDEGGEEDEEERVGWRCMEKSSGKFLRRFKLPENANSGEVTAAMENGVLTVTMPKGEVDDESEVKIIPISG